VNPREAAAELYVATTRPLRRRSCAKLSLGVSYFRLRLHGSPSTPMSDPERDEGHSGPQPTICMSGHHSRSESAVVPTAPGTVRKHCGKSGGCFLADQSELHPGISINFAMFK
jgi:hypothetical protein